MKEKRFTPARILQAAAGILLSVFLLWWVLRGVDVHEVLAALKHADWRIFLLAPVFWGITWVLRAVRWEYLLDPPKPSFRLRWDANAIGFLCLMVLPLRIGEVVRAVILSRNEPRPFSGAAASVVLERVFDTAAVLVLLGISVLLLPAHNGLDPQVVRGMRIMGILLSLGVVSLPAVVRWGPPILRRFPPWAEPAARFLEAFGAVRGRRFLGAFGTTVLIWIANGLAFYAAARAFSVHPGSTIGSEIGLSGAFFMLGVTCLAIALPTAPGFFGTFHAGAVVGLSAYGFTSQEIIPFVMATHMGNFLMTIALGLEALLRRGGKVDTKIPVE